MNYHNNSIAPVKTNRPLPNLKYCKENVLHVYQDYRNMVQYAKDKDSTYQIRKLIDNGNYIFLEHKKSQLYPKAVKNNWKVIKEKTFQMLIKLLHEQEFLTLYNNRFVYQSDEVLFHSTANFYNSPSLDYQSLAGTYRTFNVALHDENDVIKGKLDIEYVADGDYLKTTHNVYHRHKGQTDGIVYIYKGVITFYRDRAYFTMQDIPTSDSTDEGQNYRFHRFHIIKNDNEGRIFEGVSWLDTSIINLTRTMFIDNYLDDAPYPEKDIIAMSRYDNNIPERYKQRLIDDINYRKFLLSGVLGQVIHS